MSLSQTFSNFFASGLANIGASLRADPILLIHSTRTFRESNAPVVTSGSLVRATVRLRGENADQLFVVLAPPNKGKVRIARLGGDRGRYFSLAPTALAAASI